MFRVMPYCLDRVAVLHALCALVDGRGRGVGGKDNESPEHCPGKEGAQEMLDAGNGFLG